MARYHINPASGDPAPCRAKIKCPFGDMESDHYDSKEAARAAYETEQENLAAAREEFSQEMPDVVYSLEESHGEYYLPRGAFSHVSDKVQFEYFTRSFLKQRIENAQGRRSSFSEDDYSTFSRDALKSIEYPDLESSEFWARHFDRVVDRAAEGPRSGKPRALPDNCDVHGPQGPVGSPEVAESLVNVLKELEEDDVYEMNPKGFEANTLTEYAEPMLEERGFEFLGQGVEQAAFLHVETGTVWKVPFGRFSVESKEVMKNAMVGQETFPKTSGLRHARTSGYVRGGIAVVAQECVDGAQVELSQEQHALLNLAGHSDLGEGNHGTDPDGTVVAYDTLGTVWEDLDYYELGGVEEA